MMSTNFLGRQNPIASGRRGAAASFQPDDESSEGGMAYLKLPTNRAVDLGS
jgi:hypothetical protein